MEKRVRSPNYPSMGLQEAINRVAGLYKIQHLHFAPREVVAKGLGYSSLNGASATAISALLKYGLLERSGEDLRVSDRAMCILHPHNPQEKAAAIREAAFSPALFAELMEKFPGQMPNDDLLRNYLIRNGFAESALGNVISAYRETSDMVSRDGAQYDVVIDQPEDSVSMTQPAPQFAASSPPRMQPPPMITMQSTEKFGEERSISRYDFEEGLYVRIVASPGLSTEDALDMVETMVALKRKELARKKPSAVSTPPVDNVSEEDEQEQVELKKMLA
jgi:hypothetical protein